MRGSRLRDTGTAAAQVAAARRLHLVADGAYPDWEAVYTDNVRRIYRLMHAKVANRPDAEDLTAQVFLTALPSLRLTATRAEVRSYLTATARTVLAGHWRRRFGLEITSIDVAEVEAAVLAAAGEPAPAAWPLLERILARLPERYRAVLELRFLRALSMREVAGELGISVSNAGVLQHRALRMAAELGREDPAGGAGPNRDDGEERLR